MVRNILPKLLKKIFRTGGVRFAQEGEGGGNIILPTNVSQSHSKDHKKKLTRTLWFGTLRPNTGHQICYFHSNFSLLATVTIWSELVVLRPATSNSCIQPNELTRKQ